MTYLTQLTLSLTLALAACADPEPPAWQLTCDQLEPFSARPNACKEACGADQLCAGADQPTCEAECRTCEPGVAWCPTDGWVPQ